MNSVILDSIKALYLHNTQPINSDAEAELVAGGYIVKTPKKGYIVSRAGRDLLRVYCGMICETIEECHESRSDSKNNLNHIMREKAAASARMEEALQLNANLPAPGKIVPVDDPAKYIQQSAVFQNGQKVGAVYRHAEPTLNALKVQIGGDHYKGFKIQPVEFIEANNIGFLEGCIIKRICRHADKNGVQDLQKIKHECDLLIQLRYGT